MEVIENNSSDFLTSLTHLAHNVAYTQNGAKSNKLIDPTMKNEGLLGLFYKTVRGVSDDELYKYLNWAVGENLIYTILLSFYVRDCRGGKGERDIGRKCLNYIVSSSTNGADLIRRVLPQIPEYGRWDDVILLITNPILRPYILELIKETLDNDLILMQNNQSVSLCAKWLPSENHKLDNDTNFIKYFIKYMKCSKQDYRKKYLSPLRKYIDIVERKICAKEFNQIDYSKVPSCAMHKLSKLFAKYDSERFLAWKQGLIKGETKVNAGQLFPYEIIQQYFEKYFVDSGQDTISLYGYCNYSISNKDDLLEAQWKSLVKKYTDSVNADQNLGIFQDSIVVCDMSGSMYMPIRGPNIKPLYVAVSLGILTAELTAEPYKNHIITFSSTPSLIKLVESDGSDGILQQKIKQILSMAVGMNTDIQAVFDLLLQSALNATPQLSPDKMVKRIFIISDMQFDEASDETSANKKTNLQHARNKFAKYGYPLPQIVFWNVMGGSYDVPATIDDNGTILISGFSQSIMTYIAECTEFSPLGIMLTTLNNPRYARLLEYLN